MNSSALVSSLRSTTSAAHHRAASLDRRVGSLEPAAVNVIAGMTQKGSFGCEARCFCPAGRDVVWVGERSGVITVRCARTGNLQRTIEPPSAAPMMALSMTTTPYSEMWVGTNDGRVIVFNVSTFEVVTELRSPETEKGGDITCIGVEGKYAMVGSNSHRISQWDLLTKQFVRSCLHPAAVVSLKLRGGVCYAADADGHVMAWDVHTGERSAAYECFKGVSCIEYEPSTASLWCATVDGHITVLSLTPGLALTEVIDSGAKGRLNSLLAVGGKVWGAGIEKTTFVWHAHTRKLLGKTKDHSAFVFQLGKLYTMETARIWSLSNDKTVVIYDGEGFFNNVAMHGSASEEVTAAQAQVQTLKLQIGLLEKKLALEEEKVMSREIEVDKLKDEVHKQLLKLHSLEYVIEQKDDAIVGSVSEKSKLFDETSKLNAVIADLQGKLNAAEQEKAILRGDVAKAEEAATRARTEANEKASAALVAETERKAITQDKERVNDRVKEKEAEVDRLLKELKQTKDEAIFKGLETQRRTKENENLNERIKKLEQAVLDREKLYRKAEEERRRLDDQLIVRDNELKQMHVQLQNFNVVRHTQSQELQNLATAREQEQRSALAAQDHLLLKSHEYDMVQGERERLEKMLQHERQQVVDARNNEQRLAMQNDELRRQVEKEKNAVRMLEDQYAIFQFVINSRGELINSIWNLHGKVTNANKSLRALDAGVSQIDPTKDKLTLKREWKANVVDRAKQSYDAAAELQTKIDYIIANYLSEYEKMHLGIPTSKFAPDETRPSIIGDQLLTKLRDVTLVKQVPPTSLATKAQRLPPATGSTLGVEHFAEAPKPSATFARPPAAAPLKDIRPQSAGTYRPGGHAVVPI